MPIRKWSADGLDLYISPSGQRAKDKADAEYSRVPLEKIGNEFTDWLKDFDASKANAGELADKITKLAKDNATQFLYIRTIAAHLYSIWNDRV